MSMDTAKQQVAKVARKMAELGLVSGTSGNVSARLPDGLMAITPMGKSYETMSARGHRHRGRRSVVPWRGS